MASNIRRFKPALTIAVQPRMLGSVASLGMLSPASPKTVWDKVESSPRRTSPLSPRLTEALSPKSQKSPSTSFCENTPFHEALSFRDREAVAAWVHSADGQHVEPSSLKSADQELEPNSLVQALDSSDTKLMLQTETHEEGHVSNDMSRKPSVFPTLLGRRPRYEEMDGDSGAVKSFKGNAATHAPANGYVCGAHYDEAPEIAAAREARDAFLARKKCLVGRSAAFCV